MTQKLTQTVESKGVHTVNKNSRLAKLSSIIEDVVVIRTGKTTQNCLQKPPKVNTNPKEGKKSVSPLREIMKNRNLQHELKKSKRDKIRVASNNSFYVEGKENLKKKDKVSIGHNLQENRIGILKNGENRNREKIKTPKTKINNFGKIQGSTERVGGVKKNVKFTDQYDFNGRLKKTEVNNNANGRVTKYSKFLEETHNNIKTLTDHAVQEVDPGKENVNVTLSDQKAKSDSTEDLKLITNLKKPPESFWNFMDRMIVGNDSATLDDMDFLKFLNEEASVEENRHNSENTETYSEENAGLPENGYEEPDCSFECENFIRSNFSFPVLAFGCISVGFLLLQKRL